MRIIYIVMQTHMYICLIFLVFHPLFFFLCTWFILFIVVEADLKKCPLQAERDCHYLFRYCVLYFMLSDKLMTARFEIQRDFGPLQI